MRSDKSWLCKVMMGVFALAMVGVAANAGVISAGYQDSFGVKADNSLWGWGYDGGSANNYIDPASQTVLIAKAQLGLGTTNTMVNGTCVASPIQSGTAKTWVDVEGGTDRGFGIKSDGSLWGWGYDGAPAGSFLDGLGYSPNSYGEPWPEVSLYHYEQGGALGMGAEMCQVITRVYTNNITAVWTNDSGGFFGTGTINRDIYTEIEQGIYTNSVMNGLTTNQPTQVGTSTSWRQVAVGGSFGLGLQADGSIWSWGSDGDGGQLGQGDRVVSATNYGGGDSYSLIVQHYTNDGAGGSTYYPTSTETNNYTNAVTTNVVRYARSLNTATRITAPTSMVCVAAGSVHSAAVGSDGSLWTWGKNQGGTYPVSVYVTNYPSGFSGYYEHDLMANYNTNIILGLGDPALFATNVPARVGSETTWASVSAGLNAEFTLAIKQDGSLWGWGNNGAQASYSWRMQVSLPFGSATGYGDTNPVATNTYSFRSWAEGWLGLGSNVLTVATPARVGTDNDWAMVSAGNEHCLGLKSDGSLWAWGDNGSGRLGLGRGDDYIAVPIRVGDENDWVAISAGYDHSLGLKSDGSLWGWGANTFAQLGDQEGDAYEPVLISSGWGYSGPVIAATENGGGDYDGDGKTDFVVYDASTGNWQIRLSLAGYALYSLPGMLGGPGYRLVTADFDGDGVTDPAVYQESTGTWKILLSDYGWASVSLAGWLGGTGYTAVPADYDGDGKADPAVYNKSTGEWLIRQSSSSYSPIIQKTLGAGCIPVPMDYDGDRKADPAVYESATGNWQVMLSRYGDVVVPFSFGGNNYLAVPMDYDGDGKADFAIYEESTGVWKIKLSSADYWTFDSSVYGWALGGTGYIPTPADYDGDGKADLAGYGLTTGQYTIMLSNYNYYRYTTTW